MDGLKSVESMTRALSDLFFLAKYTQELTGSPMLTSNTIGYYMLMLQQLIGWGGGVWRVMEERETSPGMLLPRTVDHAFSPVTGKQLMAHLAFLRLWSERGFPCVVLPGGSRTPSKITHVETVIDLGDLMQRWQGVLFLIDESSPAVAGVLGPVTAFACMNLDLTSSMCFSKNCEGCTRNFHAFLWWSASVPPRPNGYREVWKKSLAHRMRTAQRKGQRGMQVTEYSECTLTMGYDGYYIKRPHSLRLFGSQFGKDVGGAYSSCEELVGIAPPLARTYLPWLLADVPPIDGPFRHPTKDETLGLYPFTAKAKILPTPEPMPLPSAPNVVAPTARVPIQVRTRP